MPVPQPLLLYSTGSWLAYKINEHYYNNEHWVWCSPSFDGSITGVNPPSSTPRVIYRDLWDASTKGDLHSSKILSNKAGIVRGAMEKLKKGLISRKNFKDIQSIVQAAQLHDFIPVLYVIPFTKVASLVKEVKVEDRAHPLSEEFIIRRLPRNRFDILKIRDIP